MCQLGNRIFFLTSGKVYHKDNIHFAVIMKSLPCNFTVRDTKIWNIFASLLFSVCIRWITLLKTRNLEIGASLPSALILKSLHMWSITSCTQTCSYHSAAVISQTSTDWRFLPAFYSNWTNEHTPQHLESCYMPCLGVISFTWMDPGWSGHCEIWRAG